MFDKIQVPRKSKFDGHTAIELLHLIEQVYSIYEDNNPDEDLTGEQIDGSMFYNPSSENPFYFSRESLESRLWYKILAHIKIDGDFKSVFRPDTGGRETTFMLILQREEKLYFVFRGTREMTEWVQNSDYSSGNSKELISHKNSDEDEITISKGFIELYRKSGFKQDGTTILPSIEARLEAFLTSNSFDGIEEVYICGHSLGGALATIASVDICKRLSEKNDCFKPIVYTYASPRVGDNAFAKKVEESTKCYYRIYNTEDLVPQVPFSCDISFDTIRGSEMKKPREALEKYRASPADVLEAAEAVNDSNQWWGKLKELLIFPVKVSHYINAFECILFNIVIKGASSKATYCHAGESIPFTTNAYAISTNHNLYGTYGKAINDGWKDIQF
jgi:Lipase (class 3)